MSSGEGSIGGMGYSLLYKSRSADYASGPDLRTIFSELILSELRILGMRPCDRVLQSNFS